MIPYIRAGNIASDGLDLSDVLEMGFTDREQRVYELKHGDVLLAEASGSPMQVGRSAIWRNEIPGCCFQNTVIRFRPHAATSEYALIVFRHLALSGVFARAVRGIGILHLGGNRFSELGFPLPPIAEQRRITAVAEHRIAELQNGESALRSALEHANEQDAVILEAACTGNLVETAAALAARKGRPLGHDGAPHAIQALRSLRKTAAKASADHSPILDNRLPPGWIWARVGDVGEVTLGRKREPKHHRGSNMYPYLRVANVLEDRIDTTDVHTMNFTPEEQKTYQLRPGDILLNEGQSPELVGRPAMFRGELPRVCFQMTLLRFRAGADVDPEYALLIFRHYLHAGEFRRVSRGTTNIAHLSRKRLVAMPFPLPPLDEQRRIATEARRRLGASSEQKAAILASLERIPHLRAEVYAAAVAGKLATQLKDDEPAAKLLARLGEPPDETDLEPNPTPLESSMRKTQSEDTRDDLTEVLSRAGRALSLPELFSRAGYDRDSAEDIERFYLRLRDEFGRGIVVSKRISSENVTVKAGNAPR